MLPPPPPPPIGVDQAGSLVFDSSSDGGEGAPARDPAEGDSAGAFTSFGGGPPPPPSAGGRRAPVMPRRVAQMGRRSLPGGALAHGFVGGVLAFAAIKMLAWAWHKRGSRPRG